MGWGPSKAEFQFGRIMKHGRYTVWSPRVADTDELTVRFDSAEMALEGIGTNAIAAMADVAATPAAVDGHHQRPDSAESA